jgi:hypothetical protein
MQWFILLDKWLFFCLCNGRIQGFLLIVGAGVLDDMFFSRDLQSMRRGNRRASRTPVCRPCILWIKSARDSEKKYYGVILDINRFGICVRMLDKIDLGTEVVVQLMRDEDYKVPLAQPVEATVVRLEVLGAGMSDHGMEVVAKPVPRLFPEKAERARPIPMKDTGSKVYTIDMALGRNPRRRPEK